MTLTMHRKGISTFIATLLLMVLAVSAGVVIYAYVMGYLGGFGGPTPMGAMSIDTTTLVASDQTMTAHIRNIGHTSIVFSKAYQNGVQCVYFEVNGKDSALREPIPEGGVAEIKIYYVYVAGKTYEFKLIAEDNTQIVFNVKAS